MQATETERTSEQPENVDAPSFDIGKAIVEEPNLLVRLLQDVRDRLREPKITVPREYYRGEARLPVLEMPSSLRTLPRTVAQALRKPEDETGAYNYVQNQKRGFLAVLVAIAAGAAVWFLARPELAPLAIIGGMFLGELFGVVIFKSRAYPQDVFQDYQQQGASFYNSALIHVLVLTALILPYYIHMWLSSSKSPSFVSLAQTPNLVLPEVKVPGGGGNREPRPASKGQLPRFAKVQMTPPTTHIPKINPEIPVQPTLLGPPPMQLPKIAENVPWGDPNGILGPPSNGSGSGAGIGPGNGTGVGPGFGSGYYQVTGGITGPIGIYEPKPPYTDEARMAKLTGTVDVWVTIDAQGNVTGERVIHPLGLGLDRSSLSTIKTWKFRPCTRNHVPVPCQLTIEVAFDLL